MPSKGRARVLTLGMWKCRIVGIRLNGKSGSKAVYDIARYDTNGKPYVNSFNYSTVLDHS
jgi:hypothetical protein